MRYGRKLCRVLPSAGLLLGILCLGPQAHASEVVGDPLLELPLPPAVETLVGLPQTGPKGRSVYLELVTREAERAGLPAAVADAVALVESGYDPRAVGGVGEVGLMQIRPQTAALLGYVGGPAGLFSPEVNVHFSVKYLARAWQLANGDLCRALMKYRAGHGEERMSPLSVDYCRRARQHLASIGSPLAGGMPAIDIAPSAAARAERASSGQASSAAQLKLSGPKPDPFSRELKLARSQARVGRGIRTASDSRRFWAAHESRVRAISAKLNMSRLQIARGI